ncbi:MAG: hypothetical protein WD530_07685 [Vicingaceae bacterium]
MKKLWLVFFLFPFLLYAQDFILEEGLPDDLHQEKVIFLKHQAIEVTFDPEKGSAEEYLHLRQINHNEVIEEANEELEKFAKRYPFKYTISNQSDYKELVLKGYKYVLESEVYDYDHLYRHPEEDELIVFEYFLIDLYNAKAYKVFELDEMKVYDAKLLIRRFSRKLKRGGYREYF